MPSSFGKRGVDYSIKGLNTWSNLKPDIMSTSCRNDVTVKSIFTARSLVTIGIPTVLPLERDFCSSPRSKMASFLTLDNPNGSSIDDETLVALLSVRALIECPKVLALLTIQNHHPKSILKFLYFYVLEILPRLIPEGCSLLTDALRQHLHE